jgi:hypothetical protein
LDRTFLIDFTFLNENASSMVVDLVHKMVLAVLPTHDVYKKPTQVLRVNEHTCMQQ